MTFDQAQSPRLGQRTPVESTYVRSFDVTPGNDIADLLEAAWPGQLIHRADLNILQIYDGAAWLDIAGGIAGNRTFVGDEPPTEGPFNIGDLWYDQNDAYRAYIWDGDSWEPTKAGGGVLTFRQPEPPTSVNIGDIWIDSDDKNKQYRANRVGINTISADGIEDGWVLVRDTDIPVALDTANRKTRAYYAPGFLADDDSDPTTLAPIGWLTTAPDGAPLTIGDIWYQTDYSNHPWFWAGPDTSAPNAGWVDAVDPNVASSIDLSKLATQVENLTLTSSSTNNTADTADGRISTSDYRPGIDDLTYTQTQKRLDSSVSPPVEIEVQYQVPRVDGSIWFTQTRPRVNYCTNPSFEVDTQFWTNSACTVARTTAPDVPAGMWTLQVTNTTTADHNVAWGVSTPAPASQGQAWTASIFAELISGNGTGLTIQLVWLDASNAVLALDQSAPFDLVLNAWSPEIAGTIAEPRYWVTATAPANTAGVYLRVSSPHGANDSDVWHMGAALLEPRADLGRYFDGDSWTVMGGDGHWQGTPHASRSELTGDRIFQVWELRESNWVRKYLTDDAQAPVNGSVLVGTIDGELIADNSLTPEKQQAALVKAYEALSYGDLVHIYNDHGVFTARKADASLGKVYEAHGYVIDTAASGANVRVYHVGYMDLPGVTLTPGSQWLSTTPGKTQTRPPNGPGQLIQMVGVAPSAHILNFEPRLAVKIT